MVQRFAINRLCPRELFADLGFEKPVLVRHERDNVRKCECGIVDEEISDIVIKLTRLDGRAGRLSGEVNLRLQQFGEPGPPSHARSEIAPVPVLTMPFSLFA
jgi:hypothetical protein